MQLTHASRKSSLRALLAVCSLAGCSHAQVPTETTAVVTARERDDDVSLGPGDTFEIRVFNEAELSGVWRLDSDGTVDYPLLGQLRVEKLGPHQVANLISNGLAKRFVKNPQVSARVLDQPSKRITVIGQVTKPGTIPYQPNLSIVDAIAQAGGFTPIAARNRTTVKRYEVKDETRLEKVYEVPVADIGEGKAHNFVVHPGDTISVPERIF